MFDAAGVQGIKADLRTMPHGTQVAHHANELTRHHPLARSLIVTPSAGMIIGQDFDEVMCRGWLSQAARLSLNERDRCCVEIGALNIGLPGEDADVLPQCFLLDHGTELLGNRVADNIERQRLAGNPLIDGRDMEAIACFHEFRQPIRMFGT
jgi:hypothetical protein